MWSTATAHGAAGWHEVDLPEGEVVVGPPPGVKRGDPVLVGAGQSGDQMVQVIPDGWTQGASIRRG
jgi:hypothetical protein